jgi:hypothetical protein
MKITDRMQRTANNMQAVGLAVVLFLAAGPGGSFAQTSAESKQTSTPPAATAIAPEEVAVKSFEVTNLLNTFSEKFAFGPEIEKIKQRFPEISCQIDRETIASLPLLSTMRCMQLDYRFRFRSARYAYWGIQQRRRHPVPGRATARRLRRGTNKESEPASGGCCE